MTLSWIEQLPEVGSRYSKEAEEIAKEKADLEAALLRVYRREADLFRRMRNSREWSSHEIGSALQHIDPKLLPFLPD